MNKNFTLCCDACDANTNVRFGLSNRDEQPVRFACQTCGSPIDIVMGGPNHGMTGAKIVEGTEPFDSETNFVDLHLDFPVSFEPYEMGMTPFIRASSRIGFDEMQLHGQRLRQLNEQNSKVRSFKNVLKLYSTDKVATFKSNIENEFGIEVKSDLPEDINASLYLLIAMMMRPFDYPEQNASAVEEYLSVILGIGNGNKPALASFVESLIKNKFLKNLQHDILEIYPRILSSELAFRPALFLDFDEEYARNPIPMRVSAEEFENYKDLFKDISEIISRELVLVAGINNLLRRGNHNEFKPRLSKSGKNLAPGNLNDFADVPFGRKQEFIDDSWYKLLKGSTSNQLRNAIAHYKTEYDSVTQIVSYFPKKEGMEQVQCQEVNFLEFLRMLLIAYREMHRLHHLVKSLFYFHFLIFAKS